MNTGKPQLYFAFVLCIILIMHNTNLFSFPSYSFKHYNINNGLSQNTVYSIYQDNLGFMWFGTKDGLNRFDGNSFKTFKFRPDGILRDNVFRRIGQDEKENLWIGTDDGVYVYNPRLEEFSRFEQVSEDSVSIDGVVSDLLVDPDGDIWISVEERGVFHYNFSSGLLAFYPLSKTIDGMKMITLCLGNNGDIWAFPYNQPFIRINKKTNEVSECIVRDDESLVYNTGEIWKVVADEYNQLLIASSTKGVISLNTINMTHRVLLDTDSFGEPIFARCLTKIDPQTIWIGSESGLYIYNTETGVVQNFRHDRSNPYSISDNAIYTIYKDRQGGVWVGSFFGGVDYYSEEYNQFELFYPVAKGNGLRGSRVREFCSAPDGKIWIGTEDNGLNLFDPRRNEFLLLPPNLQDLYTNIHALYADGDYLWIGTFSKGLNRYNLKTGELTTYTHSDDPQSISHNSTYAIHKDRQGNLWIGNLSGLNIYNYEKDCFFQIDKLQGIYVQDIFEDTDGNIWIATFAKGLYCYNPVYDKWKIFLYDEEKPRNLYYSKLTSIFEDSGKRLWITTEGGGVYLFNKEKEEFTIIDSSRGLPNDVVYQIVEDYDENLWLSTNSGLVCYNPDKESFRYYTVNNGLKTNQFNYKSSYKAHDGTIYFGSIDGFVRFNSSIFEDSEAIDSIFFTDLFVNNERINPAKNKSLLKESIIYTEKIDLPFNRNSLRLEYAILNYSQTRTSQVFYKLEGLDKDWIKAGGNNEIVYGNLSPGKYKLVLAFMDESKDNFMQTIKSLSINVKPPFWLTGWAYLLYCLLVVFSILMIYRFMREKQRRVERRKMRIFQQEKERELYRSKIDFFTSVAHEIRTPLSLIKAPLDHVLMTEPVSDSVKENLQIMSKNADRLLNLTNQLLDFRKTESDAYSLNLSKQNVSALIRDTFLRFTPLAKQRNLSFELYLPEDDIFLFVDKEAFLKIISNLFNNGIKYCDSFVEIRAYVLDENQVKTFHLLVKNDGETVPDKYTEEIFKPFVQLPNRRQSTTNGTGIGLALSRSLALLLKGDLTLDSTTDPTVCFHLTIPANLPETQVSNDQKVEPENIPVGTHFKSTNNCVLLLVDDDEELLQFEEKFLSPHYTIKTAKNGRQALEVLKDEHINLIVSDIMMPEMDGFELTRQVKSDIESSHIPVILLTAKVNVEAKVEGFETGADAYIEKPFSLEVLMAQIANLLQSREKLRESFLKNPFTGANTIVRTKADEAFIKKLHDIIHENIDNSEFVVEDIAEQFNMSRASFYRKIKGILDLTPNEYIRIERLKKAAQLLREKNFKVNEICYMVGFNSPSYFTKCFQQQFGVLPKDFE